MTRPIPRRSESEALTCKDTEDATCYTRCWRHPSRAQDGALGEFERDLIRERTRAGLTAAAARGRKGGRKPVATPDRIERARAMIARGLTVREAAARLKIGKTALYAALRAAPEVVPTAKGERTIEPAETGGAQ